MSAQRQVPPEAVTSFGEARYDRRVAAGVPEDECGGAWFERWPYQADSRFDARSDECVSQDGLAVVLACLLDSATSVLTCGQLGCHRLRQVLDEDRYVLLGERGDHYRSLALVGGLSRGLEVEDSL